MKRSQIKRRPLSDSVLANLESEEKEYREHDDSNLYFRVKPNGKKSWTLRYKTPNGKWSWAGLGSYPAVTATMARKKAAKLREQAYQGEHITKISRLRKQALQEAETDTFEKLATEWLLARRPSWTDGTYKRAKGGLELHIFPTVGKRPFVSIHPMEWMDLLREMEKKGIFERLGNVRRHCKEIYDLARVTGRITHNPLDGLNRFLQAPSNENFAHVTEKDLPPLMAAMRAYPHAFDVRLALRLLMLTAVRPSELREAQWTEFDLEAGLWTIPAERMKKRRDHLVPLSRQALDTVKELKVITGAYPLLLPGRNDRKKPRSNMVFSMALRRMGYGGKQTAHGFRHIASTILRNNDFHRDYVESQLSHVEGGVSGVYNKATYLPQRREMMQWYADYLDNLGQN
ncbi:MAG: tyrosine-type recombinase/integrase [Pseudohongiella sp.]|nr:tyrosine-type recombinase/integrase [Pseudohongiella sp.]